MAGQAGTGCEETQQGESGDRADAHDMHGGVLEVVLNALLWREYHLAKLISWP